MTIAWTPGITAENWPDLSPPIALPRVVKRQPAPRRFSSPEVFGETFWMATKTQGEWMTLVFGRAA